MKVTQISYTIKNEIGYNTKETITLCAELNETDNFEECCQQLRQKADSVRRENIDDLNSRLNNKRYDLEKIERKIKESIEKWNQLRGFYSAQGIKELEEIPQLNNLLPPVIQGEIVEKKTGSMTSPSDEF